MTTPPATKLRHCVLVGTIGGLLLCMAASVLAAALPSGSAFAGTVTVQPGQTLSQVAAEEDTTVAALAAANGITNPNLVAAGAVLHVPAASPPAAGATPAPATTTVTVQPGQTLSSLAAHYGISPAALAAANGISNPNLVAAGAVLHVPAASATAPAAPRFTTVEVQPGQTLSALATRYGTTTAALAAANGITNPNQIQAGTVLQLPVTAAGSSPAGSGGAVMTVGTVTVPAGATLTSLAAQYGTTPAALAAANSITDPNVVFAGMQLTLPPGVVVPGAPGVTAPVATGDYPTALLSFPSRLALQPDFVQSAAASGVPVALLEALCWWESGWQTTAVSAAGAIGVCQIEPTTAAFVSSTILQKPLDPRTAADNIALCAAYLRYLLNRTGGNAGQALAGYYQGLSSIAQSGTLPATQAYVKGILGYAAIFAGQG